MRKKSNQFYDEVDLLDLDLNVNGRKKDLTYQNLQFKIFCKFKNKKQKQMWQTIMDNRITFVSGPAGTGKTLVALKAGLEIIKDFTQNINQIVLTKPIVEIKSQNSIGALPGDLTEKTLGYFTHFYDTLIKIVGNDVTKFLKQNEVIKENVLNFVRGSTFGTYDKDGNPIGSYCILDEAQNTTVDEMKTFISRMGEETKLVILGDPDQIDLKMRAGEKCGLVDAMQRLGDIENIGIFEFTEDDIVRDPMLVEIMKRYKAK